ncbi:type IX secretion system membrane protein PorP/SprF [Niastella caeni]|uniref:Type IX secretion system membrane protein PorP/SprF n=1 Tax=Niastella caeni TaxID=2569763 RepID=A0A4V4H167_9BACT|nr:type IX secretion system membrane protein PorP/SprF [Niastella caeni]THU39276.1 type IX secretion system membrane protein PorP/SprF [Niastella caeni]
MKKIITLCIIVATCIQAQAQQKPHYTQYILNQYIINPAITGIENYTDIKVSHRHQWTGIDGAPVTTYLTAHTPLGKKDYRTTPTSFAMPGENPRGQRYWEDYTAATPHHGIGLQVINDKTGPLGLFSAYATYAYHIGISPRTSLAAGFGAGFSRISLQTDKLQFAVPVDPAVYTSGAINKFKPDLMAGLYLYSADYFVGLSAQQIIPQKIDFTDNTVKQTGGRLVPHVFVSSGYRFLLTEDFNLIPSVLVKYINPLPVQVDVNAKLLYQDFLWLGASYRMKYGFAAMLGMNISNAVHVGYSYDYTTSALNNYSRGTHEFLVGFTIGNKYDDGCPRNVW